jgi:hypothetical protein
MKRWLKLLLESFIEARLEAARARVNGHHI